ncbi:restriction endonuclease subunit S [Microbacterium sp. GXS0129]|uniref:restriction endonuclease subunit S n=1 Tax=Microbacterium sp. GXS0129 TaxID=3377836 RepID=UPI00383B8C5D
MSRIDELIVELAPGGVEVKALGEVGEFIRGNGLQKADLRDAGFPAVHYGQIHTHYGVWATETKSFTDENIAVKLRHARPGDLLIATTSEDDDAVAKATAWLGNTDVALSGDAYIYRHELEPKYVSYFFQSTSFQDQKRRYISGTKVRRVSGDSLAKIRIPVPPLEVQREIVRILDQFTQLEAELEAELEARRRQYEHYKDVLLTFPEETQWGCVGDVCRVFGGAPFKSEYFNDLGDGLPVVRIRDINSGFSGTFYSGPFDEKYLVHNGDVLIGMDGDFKTVRWAHGDAVLNQRVSRLQDFDDENDPSFIFYLVRDAIKRIQDATQASTVKHLSTKQIAGIRIPLLPLDEQRERSAVLDDFDALVNDLSIGLPAELAARRKQYEHYRDKLLTFKEAA